MMNPDLKDMLMVIGLILFVILLFSLPIATIILVYSRGELLP